jgi:antagonist of KipI
MMLEIIDAAGLLTLQDSGRRGFQRFGVPVSGPMDWFAHQAANQLVGNKADAAVLEIGLGEATFRAHGDCVIAVTGAGYEVANYIWTFPLWTSFHVRAGWVVQVKKRNGGNWAYLAIAGGFDAQQILGSRSAYLRGKMGEVLRVGTKLKVHKHPRDLTKLAARNFPTKNIPDYSTTPVIDVIAGPQWERFDQTFFQNEYVLSSSFDRMGYRLEGKMIESRDASELISEGMTMGSVQIPPNGQPIVMMADAPTTGGYPKIAAITKAGLPVFAQCETAQSKIHFQEVSVDDAQFKYRTMMDRLGGARDED